MPAKSVIGYCITPDCPEYKEAKCITVAPINGAPIPLWMILDNLLRCESCRAMMAYFEEPEIEMDDSGLFWD